MNYKILALVTLAILVAGCVIQPPTGAVTKPFEYDFAGTTFHFRGNLFEAEKVQVEPNDRALINALLDPNAQPISFYFIPNNTENGFYQVAAYELSYKLTIINQYYLGKTIPIHTFYLDNADESIPNSPTQPAIAFLGPSNAEKTSVRVNNNLVVLEGVDFSENDRKYTDLDLAVAKMLLVLMRAEQTLNQNSTDTTSTSQTLPTLPVS